MFLIRKIGVPYFCYTDFYTDFEKSPLFLAVLPSIGWPCAMILRFWAFRWVAAVLAVRGVSFDWFALDRFAAWFAPKWPVL